MSTVLPTDKIFIISKFHFITTSAEAYGILGSTSAGSSDTDMLSQGVLHPLKGSTKQYFGVRLQFKMMICFNINFFVPKWFCSKLIHY